MFRPFILIALSFTLAYSANAAQTLKVTGTVPVTVTRGDGNQFFFEEFWGADENNGANDNFSDAGLPLCSLRVKSALTASALDKMMRYSDVRSASQVQYATHAWLKRGTVFAIKQANAAFANVETECTSWGSQPDQEYGSVPVCLAQRATGYRFELSMELALGNSSLSADCYVTRSLDQGKSASVEDLLAGLTAAYQAQ